VCCAVNGALLIRAAFLISSACIHPECFLQMTKQFKFETRFDGKRQAIGNDDYTIFSALRYVVRDQSEERREEVERVERREAT
jgi:hypothetical protein